jgi:hypothetical protein
MRSDINNRIEGHMILSNGEISTDGITLGFNEHMNINPSKYKRLGIRKINYILVDDPGYPFWLYVTFYNVINGVKNISTTNIHINLTTESISDIAYIIAARLNDFLASKGKPNRFKASISYGNGMCVEWYNVSESPDDYFELRLNNEYTIEYFGLDGGLDSINSNAKVINKNNTGIYLVTQGNYKDIHNSYRPLDNYDLSSLYFHWDIIESDNYVCEVENVVMNSELGGVKMKEYGLNDMKSFRLNEGTQHCKIWFKNDGINIIPIWFKRLLVEYVMFY